jgi:osmoprotectant transport system permease protein
MGWFGSVLAWLTDPANWTGPNGILARLYEHVLVSLVALILCALIALPIAIWLGHVGRGGGFAINISNVGRAVPTFAIVVLLAVGPLSGQPVIITIVALVLFGMPPLLTNAYVGMREVDRDVVEAARGMGMRASQLLRQVELPLAAPLILTGLRTAAVQIVATATIAAIVGGPGLGRIITAGLGNQDQAQLVAGALLVAVLALAVEFGMEAFERISDPVRRARRGHRPQPVPETVPSTP